MAEKKPAPNSFPEVERHDHFRAKSYRGLGGAALVGRDVRFAAVASGRRGDRCAPTI